MIKKCLTIILPIDLKKQEEKIQFIENLSSIIQKTFLQICNNQYGVIIVKQLVQILNTTKNNKFSMANFQSLKTNFYI